MEEIGDKILNISRWRERERERERVRAFITTQSLGRSGLLGKKDGSDQSAHLRNLIRLFFFGYHQR